MTGHTTHHTAYSMTMVEREHPQWRPTAHRVLMPKQQAPPVLINYVIKWIYQLSTSTDPVFFGSCHCTSARSKSLCQDFRFQHHRCCSGRTAISPCGPAAPPANRAVTHSYSCRNPQLAVCLNNGSVQTISIPQTPNQYLSTKINSTRKWKRATKPKCIALNCMLLSSWMGKLEQQGSIQ